MDYHRQHAVDIRIARIFNTYGPRMLPNDGRVVSNFIMQALEGKPITIYGDGTQTRSFCYVDDLTEALIHFFTQVRSVGPVNLGNPGEFTMIELATEVIKMTNSASKIVFKPLPPDDPVRRQPNLELAIKLLPEWNSKVTLSEGLKKTIASFIENYLPNPKA
jgi:UDP-glucuronate decarboxylase